MPAPRRGVSPRQATLAARIRPACRCSHRLPPDRMRPRQGLRSGDPRAAPNDEFAGHHSNPGRALPRHYARRLRDRRTRKAAVRRFARRTTAVGPIPAATSPTTRLLLLCLQGPGGWLALGGRAPLVKRVGLCALSAPSENPSGASLVTAVRAERGAALSAAMARRRVTARHDRYVRAEARRSGDENGYRVAAGLRTTESGVAPTR